MSLGDAGDFDIALSGNAYSVPTGDRTVFNASNFNSALPEGWEAFALEVTTSGNFSAETKDYHCPLRVAHSGRVAHDSVEPRQPDAVH